MSRDLADNAIVLAGASGGLGSSIGAELSERGAALTLLGRSEQRLADLALAGPRVVGDLGERGTAERAVESHLEAHGRLDGVVNAAGIVAFGPLVETDDDTLEELVATNLLGPLRLVRAALPHLGGGFVANLSAVVAEQPPAGMAAYAATKAALTAADTALRRELRKERVGIIDIRPPHTETGLARRPIAGNAPDLPEGLDPRAVARRVVDAIADEEREVAAAAFSDLEA